MFDCIIVLAHEMSSKGKLNKESYSRLNLAAEMFISNKSKSIITSGWNYRDDCPSFIAEVFENELIKKGIPVKFIYKELKSKDTVGDAYFIKQNILKTKNWKNIAVVTSDYHVDRTKKIFDFILGKSYQIEVFGSVGYSSVHKIENEKISLNAFYSTFKMANIGDDNSITYCLNKFHPYYTK